MKVLKIAFLLLFSINNLFSQNIGVQFDRNQGIIESIFVKQENIVFELDSSNSNIKNIYFFSEDSLSERFFYISFNFFNLIKKYKNTKFS